MTILGIEAAAKVAGAAVLREGQILCEEYMDGNLTHSQTLMPMIDRVLRSAGVSVPEIDMIALTAGPGSFTGLRIGAATAKGLALSRAFVDEQGHMAGGIPLMPLPTLEVLCAGPLVRDEERARLQEGLPVPLGEMVLVGTMDARRSQVYAAAFDGELRPLIAAEAMPPAMLLQELVKIGRHCLFMGDAADLYEDFFAGGLGELYHKAPEDLKGLRAGVSCLLAEKRAKEALQKDEEIPVIHGWDLAIDYLRKPQAEREREERLKREGMA